MKTMYLKQPFDGFHDPELVKRDNKPYVFESEEVAESYVVKMRPLYPNHYWRLERVEPTGEYPVFLVAGDPA
jgi:hypothetical protein